MGHCEGCNKVIETCMTDCRRLISTQAVTATGENKVPNKPVAKPAQLLVMLCKYFCVHRPRKQSISKEMNNDNALKFA